MFSISNSRYFLFRPPTDMRKSFDGLCGIISGRLGQDPVSGDIFIFVNRQRNMVFITLKENISVTKNFYIMIKKSNIQLVILCLSLLGVRCSNNNQVGQDSAEIDSVVIQEELKHDKCEDVHWSYKEETGPANWAGICPGFSSCLGESQSPVDITGAINDTSLKQLIFEYSGSPTEIINNGHTLQFNISGDNKLVINEKEYSLLQFHYHSLSEHTVDGSHYPLEVHLVHKKDDNDLAVIGILFEEGEENEFFSRFLNKFPLEEGKYEEDFQIELATLLPASGAYYHYSGSLTTPPCSEIVNWYVMQEPLTASKEQIETFSTLLKDNYRPVCQ
ncbi:MAG: carbonic anhydrase family protein [Bacteroidota bacterium]